MQYFLVCDFVAPQFKSLQWCPHQWCPHLVLSEHRAVPELDTPPASNPIPLHSPHLLHSSHAASSLVSSHHQNPTFQLLPLLVEHLPPHPWELHNLFLFLWAFLTILLKWVSWIPLPLEFLTSLCISSLQSTYHHLLHYSFYLFISSLFPSSLLEYKLCEIEDFCLPFYPHI